ncbi:MAG: HAD-IG family 5'-nucleotidase [Myxococcota bacterium]
MPDSKLPLPIRRLLAEGGLELDPPPERRIFTNRDLNLDRIPLVGFDMDYTLAIYRQDAIEALSLRCTIDKLVARGYPEALRRTDADPRFAIRGLMVDKRLGNVMKMDRHGYVGRAYHGRRRLTSEERRAVYRFQRLGKERERFAPVDTLFELPEVTLFAQLVELIDQHPEWWPGSSPPGYPEAWQDVRECIDESHRDGSIKDLVREAPERYIERDPDLPETLHKFRSAGKKLFVLTNSFFPYTDAVMTYLLGNASPSYADWTAYFDWVVVGSGKPGFFVEGRPFQELSRTGERVGSPRHDVQRGKFYQGGNQAGLQQSFGVHPDEVLYVGDHIYGDIVRSKKSSGWRTALVVQELQHELAVRRERAIAVQEIEALYTLRARIASEVSAQRHLSRMLARLTVDPLVEHHGMSPPLAEQMLEQTRAAVRRDVERLRAYEDETAQTLERRSLEVDEAFNPYWGSSFAERHDTSRFGSQVEYCLHLHQPGEQLSLCVALQVLHLAPWLAAALAGALTAGRGPALGHGSCDRTGMVLQHEDLPPALAVHNASLALRWRLFGASSEVIEDRPLCTSVSAVCIFCTVRARGERAILTDAQTWRTRDLNLGSWGKALRSR